MLVDFHRCGRIAARAVRRFGYSSLLTTSLVAHAASLNVVLDGLDGEMKDAALAASGMAPYTNREISAAQAHRLYEHAPALIGKALEPYGYYQAKIHGELRESPQGWTAVLHVQVGEPVTVAAFELELPGPARDEKPVRKALATFTPKQGQRLEHAAYEKSKTAVQAALLATGYLDAKLIAHSVKVSRADNRASITLQWQPGVRYRYGTTNFTGSQFYDVFLDRYLPWREGDYYDQAQLLQLQQKLIDADYFAIVEVQPDVAGAHDGIVPIVVALGPAKRNIYTAGIFIDTDIGVGVRGGVTRRWVNSRGHKAKVEVQLAQRLKSAAATYSIPLPGDDDRSYNFGANYLDQNTDTTQSHTKALVANETRQWLGFTRTLGVHALTGDFTILDPHGNKALEERGDTTLLYPEALLERKRADDLLFVHEGYSLALALRATPGLASDTHFVQVRADAKWIHGFGKRERLILRGSLGAMAVGDFDKLPPELRFFAGGDRSIRGYGFQTIGPHNENGLVVGGRDLAVASAEFEHYFTRTWGVATFVDAGDAFSGFGHFRTHVGAGVGLRWRSPVGMLRADIGTPLHDPDGTTGIALHLVIGPDL